MHNKNITVLGAGKVGRTIAIELAKTHNVQSIDYSTEQLQILQNKNPAIRCTQADLLNNSVPFQQWVSEADLVISAVPGYMGFEVLRNIILSNKPVVDISFFPESIDSLDQLAKEKGVMAVMDCGVAPGMSNLILGQYANKMEVQEFCFYVGGLPVRRDPPFEYKAPFSAIDVIEEYTRPARLRKGGKDVIMPALSENEMIHFDEIGDLEGFNTDGLRSLLHSFPAIPEMSEKTLRYPGHAQLIETLKDIGFFKPEHLQSTARVLIDCWKQEESDKDLTAMRVILRGKKEKQNITIEYSLLDYYDDTAKLSSMSRTTGYTCCAMAEWMLMGKTNQAGVFPPEMVGKDDELFRFILEYLRDRNVNWKKKVHA
ncbi:MAG: saccharopine dehydrogenase C-terminal domain-containing protein [Chitinophagia bacterium]|jgi:saccharopine dehydrogenase-like NADP-dependent oxidoreductase